ncbi:helix-turn-helix domain-containing protein [Suttonella indologenes]|uniref:Transcriptional repressor DicA n=1 Tax=Suttonella indologenes TaxID=13276 RepID=A0A380MLA9_9GAMM|nr:transcriptional repressor DicA [Suttonella indologenes]
MKSTIKQSIGQAVAKQRKAVGLTQAQLAERLNLSLDAISRLERGNIGLTVERMVELAEIFGCETVDLLHEGSTRVRDQARELEDLLQELAEEERIELLSLVRQMIEWKRGE